MGEIKSTLDLVMERTRHLSMSAEEKAHQHEEDFSRRLQGLLQQFADGALSVERLQTRISELQTELAVTGRQPVLRAIFGRIDPDGDNQAWLDLLAQLAPALCPSMEAILGDHRQEQATLKQECETAQRDRLARDHGIRGSAVVPNPLLDATYREHLAGLQARTRQRIDTISA
ncbi:hypothetical protein [Desulfosarcina ovata]|uniref:Uncharacterized protein n=1 Tax=Desulfosarcina ovata subsp. ovata TaxID=2752305 RepID=A0A5K8AEN0_9BACT|nr:hypothetical protein [Desulfosarcina ovata]BBO90976.1 hypothetical protein DSCOOX_41560 [Desulfosarcina ovata subsp. ovata]